MPKDRTRRRFLASDVQLVIERSSEHPVEYAIVLLVLRDGRWRTVRTFDNAHDPSEHHEHVYVGLEKQPPIVTYGPVTTRCTRPNSSCDASGAISFTIGSTCNERDHRQD